MGGSSAAQCPHQLACLVVSEHPLARCQRLKVLKEIEIGVGRVGVGLVRCSVQLDPQ